MNTKRICLLVGSMAISGGTYVIVQHAAHLADQGFDVTLAVQEPFTAQTLTWHDLIYRLRCVPIEIAKEETFDLVIATWWKTALELGNFTAKQYAYFVQSIESRFYPADETPLRKLVDSTYQLSCTYVTEATWIRNYLNSNYGHNVTLVRNGIRKDVYSPSGSAVTPRDRNRKPRILIEGHFGVSFKNTALALRLAREAGARDIWVLTGTPVKWIPGISRLFSQVPMSATPDVYRSCDILIKLSTVEGMFGPPLEMFHCGGTAIVFDVSGHDEYIVDGENAYVLKRGDVDGVIEAIRRLLNDRIELSRLQTAGLRTAAAWPSWDESSAAFQDWVEKTLDGPAVDREVLAEQNNNAFADYVTREQEKLVNSPRPAVHRVGVLVAHIPPALKLFFKQFQTISEVLFGSREVR